MFVVCGVVWCLCLLWAGLLCLVFFSGLVCFVLICYVVVMVCFCCYVMVCWLLFMYGCVVLDVL